MRNNYKQIALVVRDVEKAMDHWYNVLGIGPWDVRHFVPGRVRDLQVDGEPVEEGFDFICAVCWVGDIEFELIQPIEGPNIYWRHLEEKGEGLHHIKNVMPDEEIPAAIEDLRGKGYDVIQTGWIDQDVHYYFNTQDDLGLVYEIGNGGPISPAEQRYPSV